MAGQQMDPVTFNMYARQNLLATGIKMNKRLAPVIGQLGESVKIPLQRMGIMTGVLLQFTVPVNITATAVASLVSPWNIARTVTYNDFAGVQRTKTSGYSLWAANSMKAQDAISAIPRQQGALSGPQPPSLNYDTDILGLPVATGESEITFSLYVPMAYNPASDLTGAILTQTNVGEHYITVDLARDLVNADPWIAPYVSGTVTTTGVKIEAFQYYIQPQNMDVNSLPFLDLSTVYGYIGGFEQNANISTGQDLWIDYPNNRTVLSALFTYENGGQFTANGADINQITLIANSNTNFREMTPRMLRETMRNVLQADLPTGTYYMDHRLQPIMTQLYANVQLRLSLGTVNAGTSRVVSQYEVQYASGAPLPGVTITS